MIKKFLFIIGFILILSLIYIGETFSNSYYFYEYNGVLGMLPFVLFYLYLILLFERTNLLNATKFKDSNKKLLALPFTLFLFIALSFGIKSMNKSLLDKYQEETTATIKDCHKNVKGYEICIYSYWVNGKKYEIYFSNEQESKYKNIDQIKVIYYPNNPIISMVK